MFEGSGAFCAGLRSRKSTADGPPSGSAQTSQSFGEHCSDCVSSRFRSKLTKGRNIKHHVSDSVSLSAVTSRAQRRQSGEGDGGHGG